MSAFWAWLWELLRPAPITEQDIYQHVFERWRERFWWRFEPPEGWQVGYTCHYLPWEAVAHVEKYGRIIPPTRNEVIQDINRYGLDGIRRCPADTHVAVSMATH